MYMQLLIAWNFRMSFSPLHRYFKNIFSSKRLAGASLIYFNINLKSSIINENVLFSPDHILGSCTSCNGSFLLLELVN